MTDAHGRQTRPWREDARLSTWSVYIQEESERLKQKRPSELGEEGAVQR